jgi:hypothetical protein
MRKVLLFLGLGAIGCLGAVGASCTSSSPAGTGTVADSGIPAPDGAFLFDAGSAVGCVAGSSSGPWSAACGTFGNCLANDSTCVTQVNACFGSGGPCTTFFACALGGQCSESAGTSCFEQAPCACQSCLLLLESCGTCGADFAGCATSLLSGAPAATACDAGTDSGMAEVDSGTPEEDSGTPEVDSGTDSGTPEVDSGTDASDAAVDSAPPPPPADDAGITLGLSPSWQCATPLDCAGDAGQYGWACCLEAVGTCAPITKYQSSPCDGGSQGLDNTLCSPAHGGNLYCYSDVSPADDYAGCNLIDASAPLVDGGSVQLNACCSPGAPGGC